MKYIKSQIKTTDLYFVGTVLFMLLFLTFVLKLPLIINMVLTVAIICFFLYILLPDEWIIYIVFLSNILFLDFLFKKHDLFEAILPISFLILFSRRILKKNLDFQFLLTKSWPFLLYFSIGFYWFAQKGMMPTIFSGKNALGIGNFSIFYNILLNLLALLLPFVTVIKEEQLTKFLRTLLFVFILKAIFLIFYVISEGSFYFPFFISFTKTLKGTSVISSEVNRNNEISVISYIIILYTLSLGNNLHKSIKILLISFAIGINIIWGGGRVDLMCSVFVIIFVNIIRNRGIDWLEFLKSNSKFLGVLGLLLVFFYLFGSYIPAKQQERFGEILNPQRAYKERIGKDRSRIEMWRYALQESLKKPLLGHGISEYFDIEKYKIDAYKFVSTGGAHNKYISILYSFGGIGLLLFLWGSKNFFRKLFYLRKYQPHILWDFFVIYFLANYLIRFGLEGGIKGQYFIFYFFIGYILSYQISNITKEL